MFANFAKKEVKVKSFTRKGKVVKPHKRKVNTLNKVAAVTGGTLGLAATTYLVLKARYRKGITSSANWVKSNVNKVNVPDLTEAQLKRNNINFAVGGLGYSDELKKSTNLASYVEKKFKGHTVAVDTTSFNRLPNKVNTSSLEIMYDLNRTKTVNALFNGYNPTSRELAAQMYAYHKKYPTHTIAAFGHSYGGAITDETMSILKEVGVDMSKFKNITYGATYNGILKPAPNSLNIIDVNDWQVKLKKFPNSVSVGKVRKKKGNTLTEKLLEDHTAYHYLTDNQSLEKSKAFITPPKDWKPPITEKVKTVSKKVARQSGDTVTEEVRLVREVRRKLSAQRLNYIKVEKNSSIPASKKKQVLAGAKTKIDNAEAEYNAKKKNLKNKIDSLRNN